MITSCSNAFPSMATKPNRVRSILGFILHLTTPGHVRQVSPPWPAAYAAPTPCALAPNRDRPAGHSRPRRSADQTPGPAAGPRLSSPGPSTWKARLGSGPARSPRLEVVVAGRAAPEPPAQGLDRHRLQQPAFHVGEQLGDRLRDRVARLLKPRAVAAPQP